MVAVVAMVATAQSAQVRNRVTVCTIVVRKLQTDVLSLGVYEVFLYCCVHTQLDLAGILNLSNDCSCHKHVIAWRGPWQLIKRSFNEWDNKFCGTACNILYIYAWSLWMCPSRIKGTLVSNMYCMLQNIINAYVCLLMRILRIYIYIQIHCPKFQCFHYCTTYICTWPATVVLDFKRVQLQVYSMFGVYFLPSIQICPMSTSGHLIPHDCGGRYVYARTLLYSYSRPL